MREDPAVSFDDIDPRHAPRGEVDGRDYAIVMLLGREPESSDTEANEAAASVETLAASLNRGLELSKTGMRIADVAVELHAIEAAAGALVAALAGANATTLDILAGRGGIPGAGLMTFPSLPTLAEAERLNTLFEIAGRYALPNGPDDPPPALGLAMAMRRDRRAMESAVAWPVGASALRELARVRRRAFEEEFRPEMLRTDEARDHGPDGTLPPASRPRKPKARRRANDPARELDLGGRQNVADLMRGAPGWVLARDSYLEIRYWRPDLALSSTRDGGLHRFARAIYAYATGEGIEGADAGVEHHIRAAVKIMGELERIAPDGASKSEDYDRWVSLCIARDSGVVPAWLS